MKLYSKYPTAISALAFSPDGSKLAIGASYEHDNAVAEGERGMNLVYIKDTVMDDCRVSLNVAFDFSSDADGTAQDESVEGSENGSSRV